jgi:hypothetical protein
MRFDGDDGVEVLGRMWVGMGGNGAWSGCEVWRAENLGGLGC